MNHVTGTSYPPSNLIFLVLAARLSRFDKETAAARQVFRFLHRAGWGRNLDWARHKGIPYWIQLPIHWIDCNLKISVEVKCSVNLFASRKVNSCQWMRHSGGGCFVLLILCRGHCRFTLCHWQDRNSVLKCSTTVPCPMGETTWNNWFLLISSFLRYGCKKKDVAGVRWGHRMDGAV